MAKSRQISVIAAVLAIAAAPLHAQRGAQRYEWSAPGWMGDVAFLSLNALSSGLTAGVFQRARGESFADGFARGALGGSVHYAGIRISARRFDGAGLIGRQVSAAGISMVRNASDGRPLLDRLFVPLGPLHLYVDLADGISVQPKVNLAALTMLVSAAAESELEWDAGATLSAGAPVFHVRDRRLVLDGRSVGGYVRSGSIFASDVPPDQIADILAHERVHVLQGDWLFLTLSDPAESWLLKKIPMGSTLYRYIDTDIVAAGLGAAILDLLDVGESRPIYEVEAYFVADR